MLIQLYVTFTIAITCNATHNKLVTFHENRGGGVKTTPCALSCNKISDVKGFISNCHAFDLTVCY